MKTSVKLLLTLALTLIVGMFGAAISMRHQYDSLDKSDPYARWKHLSLPAFRAVQIIGPSAALVQIEPGTTTRILSDTLNEWRKTAYTATVKHDTLYVTLEQIPDYEFRHEEERDQWQWRNPRLVVQAPSLSTVSVSNANCHLLNFKGDSLTLRQPGKDGHLMVGHVQYNQLIASLSEKNLLTFQEKFNRIGRATITVRDSARLHQNSDFATSFTLQADSTAQLRLTGKALQQVKKGM